MQLVVADADVACSSEQLVQQGSPFLIGTGVVRSQQRKQITTRGHRIPQPGAESILARSASARSRFCDPAHINPEIGSILVQASAQEGPMRTEVDLTKLTPRQREVLTAFVRPLSKNEVMRLLQIVEATIPSAGGFSEATKQAVLHRAKAVIEELERKYAA